MMAAGDEVTMRSIPFVEALRSWTRMALQPRSVGWSG